jgi:nucleotide-binding universal stress UspA family protein
VFRSIVVPLDGSARAATALLPARALVRQTGATLTLTRVVPSGLDEAAKGVEAEQYLEAVAAELAKGDVRAATLVRRGASPAAEIIEAVRGQGADLVIMATHGHGGLQRALVGSVAERVLVHSPVPVLLLRPGGRRVTRVTTLLVPLDGTPDAALALGTAVPLAQAIEARLVLLRVALPDTEDEAEAQRYVDELAARLERAGVPTAGRASRGRVADTIVATAEDVAADFIVMSTRGLTGPARTLLGSTADEVVHAARCPILLLRQGARETPGTSPAGGRPTRSQAAETAGSEGS